MEGVQPLLVQEKIKSLRGWAAGLGIRSSGLAQKLRRLFLAGDPRGWGRCALARHEKLMGAA